eukprot:COSAG02_NODE_2921_length_7747_cov_9.003400_4_plen_96_part_00
MSPTHGLVVQLTGDPDEVVEIAFAEETTVFAVNCTLSTTGALLCSLLGSSQVDVCAVLLNVSMRDRRSHGNSCTTGEGRYLLLMHVCMVMISCQW